MWRMMRNYWINKHSFRKLVKKELIPLLEIYSGCVFNYSVFDEIQETIKMWLQKLTQPLFSIDLHVARVFNGQEEYINQIRLEILD